MSEITPIIMPKWGLSMTEGTVNTWWKKPGESFAEGEQLVDIETSKIANAYEAPFAGRLARIVASDGDVIPVGGLIGVSAPAGIAERALDAFIADFQSDFVPQAKSAAADSGLRIETVTAAGREYRVGLLGDRTAGVPVVLIHGFSGDLDNWLFNIEALAAQAPVIALELPGHGASTKDVRTGGLDELAAAMAAVLAQLAVVSADFVGHSLGGAVAMRLALDNPALVRSLVLLAPAGLPGTAINRIFVDGMVAAQSARQLRPTLRLLFADEALATRELADELMRFKRLDGVEEALRLIGDAMQRGDDFAALAARLADLPPTLLVVGNADRIVGQADRRALPAAWTVVEVESGHMPHMERASEVNALIARALEGQAS